MKYKIINHIMQKGKKTKSEKILNKSVKALQKTSKKPTKELILLSIILFSTIFNLRTVIKKRKKKKKKVQIISIFINSQNKRFSFSIKSILLSAKTKYSNSLHYKLTEELVSITQFKNNTIKVKKSLEKQILNKKHLKFYRWKNEKYTRKIIK